MLASNQDEQDRRGFHSEAGDENQTRTISLKMSAAIRPGQPARSPAHIVADPLVTVNPSAPPTYRARSGHGLAITSRSTVASGSR
jgi:hypothetical protein